MKHLANKNNFDIYKYLNLFLIAIIIALIFISRQTFISSKNQESPIRIGAGDNASAIVLHYMDTEFDSFFIEPYFIHDC